MATPVIMPKFGLAQEEGTVLRWLKAEGDDVEKGDVILEVMTDKMDMEVEAQASGVLRGIRVEADVTVPVATVLAYILEPGEALPVEESATDAPLPTRDGQFRDVSPATRRKLGGVTFVLSDQVLLLPAAHAAVGRIAVRKFRVDDPRLVARVDRAILEVYSRVVAAVSHAEV